MEQFHADTTVVLIACCQCGLLIQPNAANMCSGCIRSKVGHHGRHQPEIFVPPNGWMSAEPESRELLSICLFTIHNQVRLTDACFVWTEAHSKRIKVKLTIQKEVFNNTILQQTFVVEFTIHNQAPAILDPLNPLIRLTGFITGQFSEPTNSGVEEEDQADKADSRFAIVRFSESTSKEANQADQVWQVPKDQWKCAMIVDVRKQRTFGEHAYKLGRKHNSRKPYFILLLLKHGAHNQCTGVKPVPTGIDFFFASLLEARKFFDFLNTVLPCKYHYAQELVSHDTKNNTYDYKHTFCVEIVPICRDNIVCMPKKVAQQLGNMSQIAICLQVSNVITLIDPNNLRMADIQATTFWREPFESLCSPEHLSEFYVLDVETVDNFKRKPGHGYVSKKHVLLIFGLCEVIRYTVGMSDAQTLSKRTHLGHLLNPGNLVLAFDVRNSNVNNSVFDEMKPEDIPDVVIVKKVYDRARRAARRQWKLKRLVVDGNIVGNETESVADEFQRFMEDAEEDPALREKINIYKDEEKLKQPVDEDDESIPDAPTLAEMLDELTFEDAEMQDETVNTSRVYG